MSKEKNARRVADNEAMAKLRMIKTSPQKLNLVAQLIRNKRVAKEVSSCLQSAIANAENNHGLDVDELVVHSAYVGKNMVLKRGRPRARGRYGRILKPFSQITIVVRENREEE